ncbi:flagellar protein FlaG [Halobacteroides halobius DSM 5150]|uniref:Flagellar protein FlaG n=1 Tax=Halobacteroides halobius (strain ATCC 35273 / DSM 5150 / MD-1) TaxID=748449 RepID=L0KDE2_HALHC|nr:flagellar protein FlaG [Halobacteroides halobius]AGB42113.1 flagellar protein FlaG [Halobacteroides halobius DSM 5150]
MKVSKANNKLATENVNSKIEQTQQVQEVNNKNNQSASEQEKGFTKEKLQEGVNKLNEAVQAFHEELQFELHKESGRLMTKVVNTESNEVIKEIPPKEVLDMLGKIKEMVGLFLDEKI